MKGITIFKPLVVAVFMLGATQVVKAQKTLITQNQLPRTAQVFLQKNFKNQTANYIQKDKDFLSTEYDVRLQDGTKIDFDGDGQWEEVKNEQRKAIPTGFIPRGIRTYVSQNFPSEKIYKIEKNWRDYEVKLTNGLELVFDTKGNFKRVDD